MVRGQLRAVAHFQCKEAAVSEKVACARQKKRF